MAIHNTSRVSIGSDRWAQKNDVPLFTTSNILLLFSRYRPVIFADFLGADELLIVEEPWLKIMQKLPDPLFRQRFGT